MTHDLLLSQALEGFYLARRADGYSPDTIDQYDWALSRWLKFIGDKPVKEVTSTDARAYLGQLHGGSLSATSIFHIWKAIKAFYKWACPELDLPRVMDNLKQPAYKTKEISPLSSADIEKLLSASVTVKAENMAGAYEYHHPYAARNRLILLVMLDTGVRVGELSRLNVQDINLENCEVTVKPFRSSVKSRPRTVFIGRRTQKELWKYLLGREQTKNDPLFLSSSGRRMTADSIKHLVRRISQRAGVAAHPHAFRHTFAIEYLRNNGDVFTLQRLLGHSSLDMTRQYLALANSDMETAHRRASPVDNWKL